MVQGTGSDVGKSVLVAGFGRAMARRGLRVRPFKPQNMSNNAAVAEDGGEISRAQALQAKACRVSATAHMNPVLLKPQADTSCQVVVQGRVLGTMTAREYRARAPSLLPRVLESFARVGEDADIVLVEGAGSPAEVNLRAGDIANMGFAQAADVPVLLVGDIDRGGVIASIVGTADLLPAAERALLAGYVVNKFRGDPDLFRPALPAIAARTGLECLGIVPYVAAARLLPAEDSAALDSAFRNADACASADPESIRIAVPRLPRIANFDDLDPLTHERDVTVELVEPGRPLPLDADLVLLPGSKATLADLAALRAEGWDIDILAFARAGGRVLGLCGGYQMLGRTVADPGGIEGPAREAAGLGLLDVATVLGPVKTLRRRTGTDCGTGIPVTGYEMHMGTTAGADCARPLLALDELGGSARPEGARSGDGRIAGCYLHGLFESDPFRHAFLAGLRGERGRAVAPGRHEARIEAALDEIAAHVEANVDLDRVLEIARRRGGRPLARAVI
jgi:adenosylcobyric acid synthase